MLLRILFQDKEVRHDQADGIRAVISVYQGVLHSGHQTDILFQGGRKDKLSVFHLELLFDPAGNVEIAIFIQPAPVARSDTTVRRHDFLCLLRFVVVTLHHIGTITDDFPILCAFLHDRPINHHLYFFNGPADRTELECDRPVHRNGR